MTVIYRISILYLQLIQIFQLIVILYIVNGLQQDSLHLLLLQTLYAVSLLSINLSLYHLLLSIYLSIIATPIIETHPQNASILTDRSYTLVCDITGAPFPDVTWLKDDVPITYTDRVHLELYDASLHFTITELEDAGIYQCLVKNKEGSDNSSKAILEIKGK